MHDHFILIPPPEKQIVNLFHSDGALAFATYCSFLLLVTHQGLPPLVLHEIQLLKDIHHTETEEEKISSSSLRSRLLGTIIAPPRVGIQAVAITFA